VVWLEGDGEGGEELRYHSTSGEKSLIMPIPYAAIKCCSGVERQKASTNGNRRRDDDVKTERTSVQTHGIPSR